VSGEHLPVPDLRGSNRMEIKQIMTDLNFSRWFAVGALALTIGMFSRSANGQDQKPTADQKILVARADAAPVTTLTAVAHAASAAPAPSSSSSYSWTGFHVGVNFGRGSSNTTTAVNPLPSAATFVNLLPQTFNLDPSGLLGGGQVGYDWQHGHFLLGIEGDIDAAGIDGKFVESPIIQNNNTPFPGAGNNITVHTRTDALSTVRPRVGFVLGSRFLVYGTGGLAIAHVGYTASTDFRPVGTTQYNSAFTKTQKGWAGGGGAEFAIGAGWSVRGEYLKYDVGSVQTATVNAIPLLPPFQVNYVWTTDSPNLFRFGVNYKF
jgi:outer membrane immunogenic protein